VLIAIWGLSVCFHFECAATQPQRTGMSNSAQSKIISGLSEETQARHIFALIGLDGLAVITGKAAGLF